MNYPLFLLVSLVAALHFYFLVLEMFFWTKPLGLKIFNQTIEQAKSSATLAANQGLYNGFISAGIIWGMFQSDPVYSKKIQMFFLCCVVIAGIFGAKTVNKKVFFVQALPALAALAFFYFKI